MISTQRKTDIPIIELKPLESAGDLALPERQETYEEYRPSFLRRHWLFIVMVVLPVASSILYFGYVSSNVYAVDASYIVRAIQNEGSSPLSILSGGQNMSRSEDDTFAVNRYLQSRSALSAVEPLVRSILADPSVDAFHRFPGWLSFKATNEALFHRFLDLISVNMDGSGITTIEVRAFDPAKAKELAEQLLALGENMVNEMNQRAVEDSVRQAKLDVKEAEDAFKVEQMRLMAFRNRELTVDPGKQSASMMELVSQLMGRVAQEEATLAQMVALSPKSPQIAAQKAKIKALLGQIEEQRSQIIGGDNSIAQKLSEFEQISLSRELATRRLVSATSSLERARQEARHQQFYLETIVKPVLPDQPRYPRRLMNIMLVGLLSLVFYWIVRKSVALIAEHQV